MRAFQPVQREATCLSLRKRLYLPWESRGKSVGEVEIADGEGAPPPAFRPARSVGAGRVASLSGARGATDPASLGMAAVFAQVRRDLFGTKDVQDVATASYVWLADQLGHVTLGLVPTALLCWGMASASLALHWPPRARVLGCAALAAAWLAFWCWKERDDFAASLSRSKGVFPFDSGDIRWNVVTALVFFAIGGSLALAAFAEPWALITVVPIASWFAGTTAFWWLRRKLAFQQAGCPYLYRLTNFGSAFVGCPVEIQKRWISEIANMHDRRVGLLPVLLCRDRLTAPAVPAMRHLLVTGALGAGKTSLAVGIATEFAFALGAGRYIAPAGLLENLATRADPTVPVDFDDGRILWRLSDCQLVVVDDVDAAVALPSAGGPVTAARLARPGDMLAAMRAAALSDVPLAWLAGRRSVWVIGDALAAPAWQEALAEAIGISPASIGVVQLVAA